MLDLTICKYCVTTAHRSGLSGYLEVHYTDELWESMQRAMRDTPNDIVCPVYKRTGIEWQATRIDAPVPRWCLYYLEQVLRGGNNAIRTWGT